MSARVDHSTHIRPLRPRGSLVNKYRTTRRRKVPARSLVVLSASLPDAPAAAPRRSACSWGAASKKRAAAARGNCRARPERRSHSFPSWRALPGEQQVSGVVCQDSIASGPFLHYCTPSLLRPNLHDRLVVQPQQKEVEGGRPHRSIRVRAVRPANQ